MKEPQTYDLKPCPCCGGQADQPQYIGHMSGTGCYVRCTSCWLTTRLFSPKVSSLEEARKLAADIWNLRSAHAAVLDAETGMLSCPCCGHRAWEPHYTNTALHSTGYSVHCRKCGLSTYSVSTRDGKSKEAAIAAVTAVWNTRVSVATEALCPE